MTTDANDDVLAAILIQISGHAERISNLDTRETSHYQDITARLSELAADTTAMSTRIDGALARHKTITDALDGLDSQVAAIARHLAELAAAGDDDGAPDTRRYRPDPPPRWWQLTDRTRHRPGPAARLGRPDLPARLRPARRRPPALLGAPPAVPVHPGLAQRTMVRSLPRPGPLRQHPRRPGRMADPPARRSRRPDGSRDHPLPPRGRSNPPPATTRCPNLTRPHFHGPLDTRHA